MKIKLQLTLFFVLVTAIPIGIGIVTIFNQFADEAVLSAEQRLIAVAEVQQQRVDEAALRYLEQGRLVSSRTRLRQLVAAGAEGDGELDAARGIILDALRSARGMREISIYTPTMELLVSTASDPLTIGTTEPLRRATRDRTTFIDSLYKDTNNVLFARVISPLIVGGEVVGVAEVLAHADPLIRITDDHTGLGDTGEVLLVQADGQRNVQYLTPARFRTGIALYTTQIGERENTLLQLALAGNNTIYSGEGFTDYRQEEVIAAARTSRPLGWAVVAKQDRQEVLQQVREIRHSSAVASLLAYTAALLLWLRLSRYITKPLERLTVAARRFARGELRQRVEIDRNDELGEMAQGLNTMAEELDGLYANLEREVTEKTSRLEEVLNTAQKQNTDLQQTKRAIINVLEDFNEEKNELAQSNAQNDAIIRNMGDGLVVTDKDRRVVLMNAAAQRMTQLEQGDVLGELWPEVMGSNRRQIGVFEEAAEKPVEGSATPTIRAMKTQKPVSSNDYLYQRVNGELFYVSLTASPMIVEKKLLGAIVVFRDISHEKSVDKAKTEFVSLASHQLRTPLSSINWYTEMLLSGDSGALTDEQQDHLQEISSSNTRMVDLVNSLLNVSRIEMGTFTVDPEPTNIVELAEPVIAELQGSIKEKGLRFKQKYNNALPTDLLVDRQLTTMIIQNLLSNAIKYTPAKGAVEIEMTIGRLRGRKSINIVVTDTGMGIPSDAQQKIFTKLYRADNVKEKDTEGTGLGLYLVKAILDQVGGEVTFTSKAGKGSAFTAKIPATGMKKKDGSKRLTAV